MATFMTAVPINAGKAGGPHAPAAPRETVPCPGDRIPMKSFA